MRLHLRRAAAASATVLLLGGVTACGDQSDDSSAKDDSSSHEAAALAGLSEGDTVDPADFVDTVTEGVENSTTAHLTMSIGLGSSGTMSAEGDVDYTTTPPSTAMTMTMPGGLGGDMDVRLVDGVMYLSMGDLTDGKFWKVDPSDPDSPLASMGMDKMMDQMDPASALRSLESSISEVTYDGEEDGLDHYELSIDMQKMMESMGGSDMPQGMSSQMPDSITYDVWLDDQGRFSKMVMDDMAMGAAGTASVEMNVSDWGEDVSIEAPPADQVTDMPDLGSMMGDLGSGSASS